MICPVCSHEMIPKNLGEVRIDICSQGCKSMWFDWQELGKLDEGNDGFGETLQEALNYPRYNDANRGPIKCPKCSIPMHMHKYPSAKEINVDECYQCGGFFLDSGELLVIKEKFMTESERNAYTNKVLSEIPAYNKAKDKLDKAKLEKRTVAFEHFCKFIGTAYFNK